MSINKIDFQAIIKSCTDGKRKTTISNEKLAAWLKKRRMYKKHVSEVKRILSDMGYNFSMTVRWSKETMDDMRAGDEYFPIPIMDFSTSNS